MKYALVLNRMTNSNIENIATVPGAPITTNRDELVGFYNALKVAPYNDGGWEKVFAKGSVLEWYNPGDVTKDNEYWGGIYTFHGDAPDEAIMGFGLSK